MMNEKLLKQIGIVIFLITLYLIATQNTRPSFVLFSEQEDAPVNYTFKSPEDIVRQYFESWDKRDYPNMYAVLSDGFKRIDFSAKDLSTFINFVNSQGMSGVKVLHIYEESNDGQTAIVSYHVEFTLTDEVKQEFNGKFTLKLRQGDVVYGWKLIHPYGENIDAS